VKLVSVNIGQERPIQNAKASGKTGIYKLPVLEPVKVIRLGLAGDAICDVENHGGEDQAVYLYGTPDYAWWSEVLGYEVAAGTFGENLTISELESARMSVGDRFQIRKVILEVTAPRIPCVTLARRMNDSHFVKRFMQAERPGLYCRVIQKGRLHAGDPVTYSPYPGEKLLAVELMRDFYQPDLSESALQRFLAAPIAIRDRIEKEKKLLQITNKGV
jgi:MOSC domain-containing protein YiiM